MSFTLHIHGEKWQTHLQSVVKAVTSASGSSPVPVIKGNGYGLGQELLAATAMDLGADTIAVGTVFEIESVVSITQGDIVVLQPFDPRDSGAAAKWWEIGEKFYSGRIIRTVSNLEALIELATGAGGVRMILEARSSMLRFGFTEPELVGALANSEIRSALAVGRIFIEGLSVHLPIERSALDSHAVEVMRWAGLWEAETAVWEGYSPPAPLIWVSHCTDSELATIRQSVSELIVRMRVGTRLWLGDRSALSAYGTVLAVHPVAEGVKVGYRQRSAGKNATLVVVSGGTANGIGLSAPSPTSSLRQRVTSFGIGALDATGRAMSPFKIGGKQRWFAEPPHQHVSMLWLNNESVLPQIGDHISAEIRFTTTRFDSISIS
ncbi:MAG: alanine racemase [Actinomycetia bacterium]|nr:alanine racemase [Actinomycetes bacterium]